MSHYKNYVRFLLAIPNFMCGLKSKPYFLIAIINRVNFVLNAKNYRTNHYHPSLILS